MSNKELWGQLLEEYFIKNTGKSIEPIPDELNEYLEYVAKSGNTLFPWREVKVLLIQKFKSVLNHFLEFSPIKNVQQCRFLEPFNYEDMKLKIEDKLYSFNNPPFTIQRICELLTTSKKEYSRTEKYMRAFEKNVFVVSSLESKLDLERCQSFVYPSSSSLDLTECKNEENMYEEDNKDNIKKIYQITKSEPDEASTSKSNIEMLPYDHADTMFIEEQDEKSDTTSINLTSEINEVEIKDEDLLDNSTLDEKDESTVKILQSDEENDNSSSSSKEDCKVTTKHKLINADDNNPVPSESPSKKRFLEDNTLSNLRELEVNETEEENDDYNEDSAPIIPL